MISIIPKPQELTYADGAAKFSFSKDTAIVKNEKYAVAQDILEGYLACTLAIKSADNAAHKVVFSENLNLGKEEYIIVIADDIIIECASSAGALYAVESLKQAIHSTDNSIPYSTIKDAPRHSYRGFMIDTGRYFMLPRDIYSIIDIMVLNKLNVLHWHLSDDQGWRVEIDAFKELTIKGSRRSHTNFGLRPHGGFYTKAELKDIVKYAHERDIIVIPEFDIPGHTQAAIACYPYLSCFDRKLSVATHWGVKHDILCAGKDSTYEFVKSIIDELLEIFTDKYFHIGGDEAVKTRWKLCPNCQAKITELGLKDENQLQAHFLNGIAKYLKQRGKEVIMWNEYDFSDCCDKDIIWMIWNPDKHIFDRVDADRRRYIDANSEPYYLDLPYGTNPLKAVYDYDPTLQVKNADMLLGVQASLWGEFVPNYRKALKMTFPRVTAIAERAWSHTYDYADYIARLETYYNYLNTVGITPRKSIKAANSKFKGAFENVWFGRRVLYWAGLRNLIDNYKVKIKNTKINTKQKRK